jgi:hypothetical protein
MRPVKREELLDPKTYERTRAELRPAVIEAKRVRRVLVGGVLNFLFENTATVRYQIQEMIRAEGMTREPEIQHELDTYNELLGRRGELGVSLLIEIPDPKERDVLLRRWIALPKHLYLKTASGEKVRPRYDERQVGEDRLSSVQYLRFDVRGEVPVAVGADLPELTTETALDAELREALRHDLASDA